MMTWEQLMSLKDRAISISDCVLNKMKPAWVLRSITTE